MPFTPFHFGPGALIKAAMPRHFSLGVFCFAQVVTDLEVLVNMARGADRLHTHLHTYPGAFAVAVVSVLVGRPLCARFLRWWNAQPQVPLRELYQASSHISLVAALIGAFAGSFSHVFLDSFMHGDIRPFAPLWATNGLSGAITPGLLHLLCTIAGVLGAITCARLPKGRL
jgi:hypothetical protein